MSTCSVGPINKSRMRAVLLALMVVAFCSSTLVCESRLGAVKQGTIKIMGRVFLPAHGQELSEAPATASHLAVKAYGIMEVGPPLVLIGQVNIQVSKANANELSFSITGQWPHTGFLSSHSAVVYAGLIGMDIEPALKWVELKKGKTIYNVDIQL